MQIRTATIIATLAAVMFVVAFQAFAVEMKQQPPQKPDPDQCGAGGRGCVSEREKTYMDLGYRLLPNASSSAIANFARACATRPQWADDCKHRPAIILKRLGLMPDD
ncbi:hypothetical protein EV217_5141 [Phyllobacterium myrsinacearum]|uniref:hypothetical protein n=1 Tax=Phyllobacterium myrsinacearum TaxID=28101 RepID=UPI001028A512|nr:hypothetical protein [Phyllobacterium myrsinacearum]RZS76907.1 hypothetical protein EV217_5141 [Phyllobacterium myrsinacearum]